MSSAEFNRTMRQLRVVCTIPKSGTLSGVPGDDAPLGQQTFCGTWLGVFQGEEPTILRLYWGYIGIMEKKMETTIVYLGLRI